MLISMCDSMYSIVQAAQKNVYQQMVHVQLQVNASSESIRNQTNIHDTDKMQHLIRQRVKAIRSPVPLFDKIVLHSPFVTNNVH